MQIVLLAAGDATANPRIGALASSLRSVGHEATIVCGGSGAAQPGVRRVPTRVPAGGGMVGGWLRRAQPEAWRRRSFDRRLTSAAAALDPELAYATSGAVIPAAYATGRPVITDPRLGFDPPEEPNESPAGPGLPFHAPADDREPWTPEPGRHQGRRIVLAYRATDTTPARYLRAALQRAGVGVEHVGDRLDWAAVDPETEAVVFVESPYPALEVTGSNSGVPVLLWAHHGEHHIDAHLRLVTRYGVDGVLLAHSWHLAHRYPVPVHRFPFAVAPELVDGSRPWPDRTYDVAFAGATSGEETHAERRQMIESLESALPQDRLAIGSGVGPEVLAGWYGDARIVFNDGGTRHHPITMRVFESIGSGAALLTDDAPGLDRLFTPGDQYSVLRPETVASDVIAMLNDPSTADMAAAAHAHAMGRHTYDHRVDELLEVVDATKPRDEWIPEQPSSAIARAVADDVEVSTVAAYGLPALGGELPLHVVWIDPEPGARRYDAVAVGGDWSGPVEAARADAVRYVYVEPSTRIDLKAPGYHIEDSS